MSTEEENIRLDSCILIQFAMDWFHKRMHGPLILHGLGTCYTSNTSVHEKAYTKGNINCFFYSL